MPEFDKVITDMFWNNSAHACCCMGPQDNDPVCPCAMKYVKVVNGHYIQITDLGEVESSNFNRGPNGDIEDMYIHMIKCTNRIEACKTIRLLTGLGLLEAKKVVDEFPTMLPIGAVNVDTANEHRKVLEDVGVWVEFCKPTSTGFDIYNDDCVIIAEPNIT